MADINDAAKQMARMVSDNNLRKRLGENGFEKSKEFDWEIKGKEFMSLVEESFSGIEINPFLQFNLKRIV